MAGMTWNSYANRPKGGGKFLNTWKKNGSIVIYLHTNSMLLGRFQHMIPYVGENDRGKEIIKFFTYVCAEDYNQQANNRDHVPSKCPVCLLAHYLRENDDIADNETVWDASIGSKLDRIVTKADFIGEGDWRNSFVPRHQAVFGVVDVEDLDGGLKTMVEPISVADAIGQVISHSIESDGEEGDPAVNPYPIKLKYDENAVKKTDYYSALRYNKYKPKGEDKARIEELLESDDMNLIVHTKPRNTKELLAIMKKMVTVDVDFDLIGGSSNVDDDEVEEPKKQKSTKTAKKTKKPEPEPEKDDDDVVEDEEEEEEVVEATLVDCEDCKGKGFKIKKSAKTGKRVKVKCKTCNGTGKVEAEEEEEVEDDEEKSECPACGAIIPDSAEECPKCGAEFDDEDDEDDDDDN